MKVTLGKKDFDLAVPKSYSAQRDVVGASGPSYPRARMAALGLCCPRLVKVLGVPVFEADYNVLAFGGRIQDALAAQPEISREQADDAADAAFGIVIAAYLPSEQEVAAAEVPTEPPAGG